MTDNVIQFATYSNKLQEQTSANVVADIINGFNITSTPIWAQHKVNTENPDIAFDIATIHYLLSGLAHRTQGESHPSQILLNSIRVNMLGY